MKARIALDTSVIIEYIDKAGPWHRFARTIFSEIIHGHAIAYIPTIVLSEVFYVAKRIYERTGIPNSKRKAIKLVKWLYQHPNIRVIGRGFRIILLAGLIKAKYHLALSDCYVLALAKLLRAKPVFRKKEREMLKHIDRLRRLYGVIFLDDY